MIRILFIVLCLFQLQQTQAQIYINEIQASNDTTITDNFLEYDDWIELYNPTGSSIDLKDYYLSDNIFYLTKFQIPNTNAIATTIPANGYLLFWADGSLAQGENHTNFKLSASGESVFLVGPDGTTIVDSLTYKPLTSDQTFKRILDGSNNLFKSKMASPGSTNNNDIGLLDPPEFSVDPGVYSGTQTVALSAANGATIYYTTDGSEPTINSLVYTNPITISQNNTTIKAIAVQGSFASSEVVSGAYFTNANHTLPILNISLDQKHLTDDFLGMYTEGTNGTLGSCNITANWWNDFEYPAHITLFEKDGTVGFNEIAGVEISGGCSRNKDKKAFNVGFKSKYGKSKLNYKLFEDSDIDTYDGFKIRAGGSNTDTEFTNDALVQKYIEGQLDIDLQKTRPVVLYLNGYYWGLYFIRDRMNVGYVETYHTKYDDLPVDMVKNPYSNVNSSNVYWWVYEKVMSGTKTGYYNLVSYIENNNMNITSNYEYVKTQIDMNSFIDYIIPFIFYDKFDWPGNNVKVWKASHPTSKWRWMMFDMEWVGRNGVESLDVLHNLLIANDPPQLMHLESSTILKGLFENDEFKHEFIQRTNTYINSVWAPNRIQQLANDFNNEIQPEVTLNNVKWTTNIDYNTFIANKNQTVDYVAARPPYWRTMVDNVLNVSGRVDITYNFNSNTNGDILTNSNFYKIPENYATTYHRNVPMWIHAAPKAGYRFVEWQEISDPSLKYKPSIYTSFNSNQTLTPIFEPALDVVINEIHYNPLGTSETEEFIELYNPGAEAKALYGYKFDNGVEFTFPENAVINAGEYIIIAKDASLYAGNGYQVFQWECGSLNNDGERVFFSNAANVVVDSVAYNDNIYWDQNADGLGYSLALIDHTQDNYQPSAWASQVNQKTTPGFINDFCLPITNNAMIADISCFGANDGFIANQITGGTTPFTYSWSNGNSTSLISNLAPGQYSVTISDFYNCPYTETFTVNEPPLLSATINSTDETYYQASDGSASIIVSGGTPPYTYNWSNGATTSAVYNLQQGNYTANIFDSAGCPINKTINIAGVSCSQLSVDVTTNNETCKGVADGLLVINNISNGTAPYSILWSNGITNTVTNNLAAGSYQLNINDANGCPFQNNYEVSTGIEIQASFNINNVSSANLNDGSIAANPSGGTAPYTFNWSTGTNTQNLSNVGEGVYSVTLNDANGCSQFFDQLSIGNDCVVSIVQQNNPVIPSQVFQVAQFIQSNGMVNVNEQVSFKAGDYIELTNEFEVIIGAEFEIVIDGCQ